MLGFENLGLLGLFLGCFLAATVLPFSSDALYVAVLWATNLPVECLIVGTIGNWLGGATTYYLGYIAKWEWLEKYFKVKEETLVKHKKRIDKYGIWMALLTWVPGIGDVIAVALGFYKVNVLWSMILMFIGKLARFIVWTLMVISF